MTDRYLDGDQLNLLLSKPASSSNVQLTQSAYVSAAELVQSKYDQEVLPKSDVRSPRDEFPNFYTNMNSDLELQGYYFARHTEGEQKPHTSQEKDTIGAVGSSHLSNSYVLVKPNSSPRSEGAASNDIQPYEASNVTNSSSSLKSRDDTNVTKSSNDIKPYESVDIKSSSTSVQSNRSSNSSSGDIKPYEYHDVTSSSNSIKPYESTKVEGYEYNSSDSSLQSSSQQNGYHDERQQEKDQIQGYGGYELDSLARLVLHKPSKESNDKEAENKTNEEDAEILNTISAFEDIINSEDNSDQKNLSNESQEVVGDINLFYNTEFRRLMSLPDSVRKFEQLGQLANDFVYNAETYGRIIISERTLPPESKTVKPAAMGGQAGGEKFVVRGILFKYAVDTTFAYRATPFWMYGGSTPDDERASKAGGHELLGCANIMNCNIPDLNTPLMALIDYKGYRLVAMSFLPISKGSLVYGSSDAGKTIHNDAPPLLPLMKKVGRKLNLLEHLVGSKRIIGPGDIEVHRGDDDRFYIVDFARLFPPAKPEPGTNSRAVFYEFLRPELVQSNPVPLTSDAFTSWNKLDPNVKKQEADVEAATKRLREEVIPSYAAKLADPETIKRINENWISLMILELHNEGINLRFLGRIRRQPCLENNTEAQRILVTEMVCRTLKNELRGVWRSQLNRMKLPLEQPFRKEALKILNYFADPNGNQYFWQHEIKVSLMHKYGSNSLTDKEKDNNVSLYHHLQLNASHLVVRFCELTGIEVSERALDILETHQRENIAKELQIKRESDLLLPNVETKEPSEQKLNISAIFKKGVDLKLKTLKSLKGMEMNKKPCEFEFVDSDITAIKHKVKYTSFIDYATGIASLLKVMRMKDWKSNVKVEKQVSMLHHARMRFQNAISLTPNSFIYRFNLARTMLELFKRKWSQRKESICAQVFDKLKEVVNTFPDSSTVLYDWAISGFFYAYGFSRSNASVKDDVGQQARDALTKALKRSPALLNKINAHMDSWAWMLCNQFDTLMLHSPSYSSTHGLWDELHNLVVIGLQLSSTALAAAYDRDLALISIRFAVHAIVYLHCLTDLRFGLEKTLPTATYYLYTKKQRSIFNLCIKHIWDTMRQMQKTDRLLVPIYEELEAYYKEWQKIVTKPKLLKSDVSIMNAYTSSSRHLSNFDFHYNRLHYLSALFQRVIVMEHDEIQFIPPDSSTAFELLDADPQDNEKDYEEASGFIVAWMTYDWDWSDPRLSEEEEDFFLDNVRPILTFNAENLPLYPKLREYIWMWSNIYIDFCFMQWSGTLSNRGLNLIEHLNTRFPDFSCQTLVRQLKELEPYIVEQKDLFFYWKGAQLFHSLHKLKQSKFYKDTQEYLHFFWTFFDNAIFMKQFVNQLDDGEGDPYSEESSCIQELVDDLLKDHPEQAENILTRVKTMLDLILQTNDPLAREALGSNVYSMKLTMIVTLCICIYSARRIDNITMGSAIWIMHLLLTRPPFKIKMSKQFDTYDIISYDAAELKAEALKKYPKVASDPRWQIPSNLHVVKFESVMPNTYDGTGFRFELDDNEDDEEGMMDDIVQNSAHQKRKQKNARKGSKAQKNAKSSQK